MIMMTKIKANALVKRNSLMEPYGWIHEQGLLLVQKLLVVDEEHGIDLYQAYNIDTDEWAGVTTEDVLIIDERITKTKPNYPTAQFIVVEGPKVRVFKEE